MLPYPDLFLLFQKDSHLNLFVAVLLSGCSLRKKELPTDVPSVVISHKDMEKLNAGEATGDDELELVK